MWVISADIYFIAALDGGRAEAILRLDDVKEAHLWHGYIDRIEEPL
jgi:hypothetical protein